MVLCIVSAEDSAWREHKSQAFKMVIPKHYTRFQEPIDLASESACWLLSFALAIVISQKLGPELILLQSTRRIG